MAVKGGARGARAPPSFRGSMLCTLYTNYCSIHAQSPISLSPPNIFTFLRHWIVTLVMRCLVNLAEQKFPLTNTRLPKLYIVSGPVLGVYVTRSDKTDLIALFCTSRNTNFNIECTILL